MTYVIMSLPGVVVKCTLQESKLPNALTLRELKGILLLDVGRNDMMERDKRRLADTNKGARGPVESRIKGQLAFVLSCDWAMVATLYYITATETRRRTDLNESFPFTTCLRLPTLAPHHPHYIPRCSPLEPFLSTPRRPPLL